MTTQSTPSVVSDQHTDTLNESTPEGCINVRFSEMEYLPWNNPDNLVSLDVPLYTGQVRTNLLQILLLIGGPANVINMAVFFKQGLRDRVNLLLFSLAVSDVLGVLVLATHFIQEFYRQFTGEKQIGPLLVILVNNHFTGFFGFVCVSFTLSAIIACERCCCVMWPLRYQTLIRTRTVALIIIAVYVTVLGLYFIVESKYYLGCVYDSDTGLALTMFVHSEFYLQNKDLVEYLFSIFFGAGLPSVTLIVVITATVTTIIKLRQVVAWRAETTSSVSAGEVALTKMLVGTSVLLIICVSPHCIFRVACLFLPELNIGRRYENLYFTGLWMLQMLSSINSSFNLFVYYAMGTRYRATFWALFQRKTEEK